MGTNTSNKSGYSIVKSFKPLVVFCVSIVLVSDLLFVALLLLIVGIRNVLGVDVQLVALALLIFSVKSAITAASLYKSMKSWLGVSYFVFEDKLYIQSDVRQVDSVTIELKNVHKATTKNSYQLLKKNDYGDVIIEFTKKASDEIIILHGVKSPQEVAASLLNRT